jgi:hypothetical protein
MLARKYFGKFGKAAMLVGVDYLKYPNSSEFEIEMPEDILNVVALRLMSWTFPANYNTFSKLNSNVLMIFKINNPYNPNINGVTDLLIQKIYECLFYSKDTFFEFIIEDGFYNPEQMITELTNKFNHSVTMRIQNYFKSKATDSTLTSIEQQEYIEALALFISNCGYQNFIIVYNIGYTQSF